MLLLLIEKCFNNAFKLSYKVFAISNANEIIRAVLNSLIFFFLQKDFARSKSAKAQRRNQAREQNATSEQKWKMRSKTSKGKKVTYSFICVFVRAKKRE